MARIPYAAVVRRESAALTKRIVDERGSVPHLYAMLLHSGPVTEGWLRFLTAIRRECALPGIIRELVIMQVARLNDARYEAEQHAPIALQEGLSQAQIDALPMWQASTLFDDCQRAALAFCDAITRQIHVEASTFEAIQRHFNYRLIVELTATIAAYNMVSRFIEAIGIESTDTLSSEQ